MENQDIISELDDFARQCIDSHNHPDDYHRFTLFKCNSCKLSRFRLTIEHHTGSEEWNFRGIIWGECAGCGYLMRLFTFTGEHRQTIRDYRPECECGNRTFSVAMCERYEGERGIPGFFDEGVIVGKCEDCGRKSTIVFTD
jgi:hypothetical protein